MVVSEYLNRTLQNPSYSLRDLVNRELRQARDVLGDGAEALVRDWWIDCAADALNAGVGFCRKIVFPNADDFPSVAAEGAGYIFVSCQIFCEFGAPEVAVVDGEIGMFWTAVPEASIDEDDDAFPAEGEVGFSKKGKMPAPASDPVSTQEFCECEFSVFVAAPADFRHDLRSLGLGEDVRHRFIRRGRWLYGDDLDQLESESTRTVGMALMCYYTKFTQINEVAVMLVPVKQMYFGAVVACIRHPVLGVMVVWPFPTQSVSR